MAINRIRQIKPDFFEDPKVATVGLGARLFFIGLWCRMDRNGVIEYNPKLFRGQMYPFDEEITPEDIARWIDELCNTGMVEGSKPLLVHIRKESKSFLWAPAFQLHQKPHHREQERYSLPLEDLRAMLDNIARDGEISLLGLTPEDPGHDGLWVMIYEKWVLVRHQPARDNDGVVPYAPMPDKVKKQISQIFHKSATP